jgi:predicted membrane-bound dolichyl-phosphate-mannose-protein mannosyltransferase
VLRLVASRTLTPHVDEAASVLAARVVSEQFIPILPSGNVYFQGFTLSLALAPLAWLGLADLDHLALLRLVSVVAGTAAIVLAWRLALYVTRNPLVALGAALLVALDPLSVQWSGHVRMYALLQLASFGLAWIWIDVMGERATNRRLALGVLLGWFAVFTHSGASLSAARLSSLWSSRKKGT